VVVFGVTKNHIVKMNTWRIISTTVVTIWGSERM